MLSAAPGFVILSGRLHQGHGFRKALIVTDKILGQIGVVARLTALLAEYDIESVVFDETKPNPTMTNVESGLAMIKAHGCDCVISLGGGSPHDCAKGIALVATNGGSIQDYEGVDCSARPQLPLIAINTTAGTASEMTRFCIITDEARQVKMAIIDKHVTPLMSVNDPELMLAKPAGLTAATGMDALTHAIEAYVSTAATPVTDASAVMAIQLIAKHLRTAVNQGDDLHAREQMAYAQFLAGMAFNNASLGYVHAMAHQLGGFYDLPHGGLQRRAAAPRSGLQRPGECRSPQRCGPSHGSGRERHERRTGGRGGDYRHQAAGAGREDPGRAGATGRQNR